MIFNKKHKPQPQNQQDKKSQKPNSLPQEQKVETEEQRNERWMRGNFVGMSFSDKGGRWIVQQELGENPWKSDAWLVSNMSTLEWQETNSMRLYKALAENLIYQKKGLLKELNQIQKAVIDLLDVFELVEEELRVEKKNPTVARILNGIQAEVFKNYQRPSEIKKEVVNE